MAMRLNLFVPRGRRAAVWGGVDRPEWWRGRAPTRRCIRPPRLGRRRCTPAPPLLRPWTIKNTFHTAGTVHDVWYLFEI